MGSSDSAPPSGKSTALLRLLAVGALVAAVAMAGLLGWHSLVDLDVWFHLRAGRDLLAGGGFPHTNTYAFTDPGHPWLNHEWLFQMLVVATSAADPARVGGWNALRLLLAVGLALLLVGGDGRWRHLAGGRTGPLIGTAAALMGGLWLLWPRLTLRPELVSYLAFVVLVRWADGHYLRRCPARPWRDRNLWRLFVLVVVWAQFHGFAALAPLVLLVRVAVRPFDRRPAAAGAATGRWSVAAVWAPVLLGTLALVLTPNLWHGLAFPLRALGQFRGDTADLTRTVSELTPLLATRNSLDATLLVFKLSLGWGLVFALLAGRSLSPFRLVVCGLAAAAALANQRSIALFGLAFILLQTGVPDGWPDARWRERLKLGRWPGFLRTGAPVALAVAVVVTGVWWGSSVVGNGFYLGEGVGRRFGGGTTPATYPFEAAGALPAGPATRTFANLDAAAFLLANSPARLYVDGRTEAYPATRWRSYLTIKRAGPQGLAELTRAEATAVVLALRSGAFTDLAAALVTSPAWRPVAAGAAGVLFLPAEAADPVAGGRLLQEAADRVLVDSPSDPTRRADACLAAAALMDLAGSEPGAARALAAGLAARPDHPTLNHNQGNRLLAAGQFGPALEHFRRALAGNGRLAGSALNAGVCEVRLGRTSAAVADFRRAVALDPGQIGAWVNLAVALRSLGDDAGAVRALEKAVALRPGDARLQGQLRQWRQEG